MTEPRTIAALAILQTALFAVPMIVLGQAIGWPASLALPPAEFLPLIHAHRGSVQLGYWAYLLVSVALIPLALALRSWFAERIGASHWLDSIAAIGVAAGVLKTLGIVRWLVAMPVLAAQHAASGGDPAIAAAAGALNLYAGSVGELLGVQVMSGLWLLATGLLLARHGLPVLGAWGALAGLLFLATAGRTAMPELAGLQAFAVPLALAWFLALATAMWRQPAPLSSPAAARATR